MPHPTKPETVGSVDMPQELWKLANLITGFAVLQAIAFAFALGDSDSLKFLQNSSPVLKSGIAAIACLVAAGYAVAIFRCSRHGALLDDEKHRAIWNETTRWRVGAVVVFTGIALLGLFAKGGD